MLQVQISCTSKPVISSDCLSLKRILTETDAGYIYRNDSPEELAELLEKLSADREMLQEKGRNGRKAVISGLNWSSDRERLISSYRKLER
jgi:glycosyltransferase involved in cell wall biosynthesis